MKKAVKTGFSFGLTSGVITTLGLMTGLYSGTNSKLVVVAGILTIAVADALSDSLGIHISQESDKKNKDKQIWASTFSTFLAKFFFALTFLIPILLFELKTAIIISIIYGLALLSVLSANIAKKNRVKSVILEHLLIALIVIIVTYFVGLWVNRLFLA